MNRYVVGGMVVVLIVGMVGEGYELVRDPDDVALHVDPPEFSALDLTVGTAVSGGTAADSISITTLTTLTTSGATFIG